MQENPSLRQSIRRGISLQLFKGLHKLKYPDIMAVGAPGFFEQSKSLLKPSRITEAQFILCISQFLVTILENIPKSKSFLFLQQQIGAEAAWAASTMKGYFILNQAASIPPQEPPQAIIGQFSQYLLFIYFKNQTQSIRAYSVVKYTRFSFSQEVFWSPKGMLTPKYRCSAYRIIPPSSLDTTSLQKPEFLQNISMGPQLPQQKRIGPDPSFQLLLSMRYFCLKVSPDILQLQCETFCTKQPVSQLAYSSEVGAWLYRGKAFGFMEEQSSNSAAVINNPFII